MKTPVLLGIIFIFCFFSCKKSEVTTRDLGYDYYPSSVGDYKIYEVDCLVFNDFTLVTDTYHFYLKDFTESEFTDNGNRNVKRIERYKSLDNKTWQIQKVWASYKNNFLVEEQLDNVRLIKLVFPMNEGATWDANVTNVNKAENYKYVNAKLDTTINGITLSKTQKVDQFYVNDPLQINTKIGFEHYTPNIGLVNKYEKIVKRFTTGVPGEAVVDSGFVYSMRIKTFKID